MTEAIAGAAIGSLVTLVTLLLVASWLLRGHRIDATGLRVVSTDPLRSIKWLDGPHADGPLPITVLPKSNLPTEPDFFDQSRERGTE